MKYWNKYIQFKWLIYLINLGKVSKSLLDKSFNSINFFEKLFYYLIIILDFFKFKLVSFEKLRWKFEGLLLFYLFLFIYLFCNLKNQGDNYQWFLLLESPINKLHKLYQFK